MTDQAQAPASDEANETNGSEGTKKVVPEGGFPTKPQLKEEKKVVEGVEQVIKVAADPMEGRTRTRFFFKKTKKKDVNGNVVQQEVKDEKTGKISMQDVEIPAPPAVELDLKLLDLAGIVNIINSQDEKQHKLLIEAANNIILEQAKEQVNQDLDSARTNGLDDEELTWAAIAALPPSQRKGAAIADEVWEAFQKDYVAVMVQHGKDEKAAQTGAKLLSKKYAAVKTNKKLVEKLKGNLSVWFTNTTEANQETFKEVYEMLASKAETLLEADEDALLKSI